MDKIQLAAKYTGQAAHTYDEERQHTPGWLLEQAAVQSFLQRLVGQETLLDIPVGTGRFIDFYKSLGFQATGIDISDDMLSLAQERARALEFPMDFNKGDIFQLAQTSQTFDTTVCVRLFQWLDDAYLETAFMNLAKVTNRYIVLSDNIHIKMRDPILSYREYITRTYRKIKRAIKPKKYPGAPRIHHRRFLTNIFMKFDFSVKSMEYTGVYKDFCSVIYLLKRGI